MHFLANLQEVTDEVDSLHSISYTSHRAVPYRAQTKRVAYCIHSLTALKKVLEEQKAVKLNPKVAFRHFEQVDGMECDSSSRLSMKDKIARARANATNLAYLERIEQTPTSRIALVISQGEGRSTREAEIIYWPNLYKTTNSFKFQLCFFCSKIRTTVIC